MPLFQPMQWVTAEEEITQILTPFQRVAGTTGQESTIQLKKRRGSETGSQVIGLGWPHPHKKTTIGSTED